MLFEGMTQRQLFRTTCAHHLLVHLEIQELFGECLPETVDLHWAAVGMQPMQDIALNGTGEMKQAQLAVELTDTISPRRIVLKKTGGVPIRCVPSFRYRRLHRPSNIPNPHLASRVAGTVLWGNMPWPPKRSLLSCMRIAI